ncbi:NAD-binding protein [Nitrosotalea devaniterrae]|uniref:NAD-binding protein n=1 Tax=Nitrosotalea devaniterrae TaxID=1078905 RepID=A0A128A0J4_9ARCH|nr:NAD-binding protein [Candidatus Nitrosotalea devanaterra]
MHRSVVITGANGFVGRNVGMFLSKNGFQTTSLVRKGKAVNFGKKITSETLSENSLVPKIRNADALLHFIGQGKQTVDSDYEKVNVGIARNTVSLCKKAKIKKIIYISGLGVDKFATLGYFISKYKAEQEIIHSGLDYTILRASYMIGNDDPLSENLQRQVKKGEIVIPGSGNYRFQPIFIDDVSRIIIKSVTEKKFSKKIIDLVGPQIVSYNAFVKEFSRGKVRMKKIDFERAYRDALHDKGSFGVDDLSIMVGDYVGNHKKLADLTRMKFTRYETVLKSRGLS